jgi:hypothetical protein
MRSRKDRDPGPDCEEVNSGLVESFAQIAKSVPSHEYANASARAWVKVSATRQRRRYAVR